MSSSVSWTKVHASMKQVLSDFVPVIRSWTVTEYNQLLDPFETHYSENYAPANAAVILSAVYRNERQPELLEQCLAMVRRSVELLRDREGVSPFCRVFLYHYSLMALLQLPESERQSCQLEFGNFYAEYADDCMQVNTNCAALQWGMELFTDSLGYRPADSAKLDNLLSMVELAQLPSHFINDELTHERTSLDGMPIAYHLFTVFILAGTLITIERWKPEHNHFRERAETIIRRGMQWILRTLAADGTLAMTERSSYQMFTWGAGVALLGITNLKESSIFGKSWDFWLKYKKEDGSYSCTPNYLPHGLRTGFESYTHVNMYNNLAMTGIALADVWLSRGGGGLTPELSCLEVPEEDQFLDADSGYAFIKRRGQFMGCTLRMHNRKYVPAMQGFHYRLDGVMLPLAEPRLLGYQAKDQRYLSDGLWEGLMLEDEQGQYVYPDTQQNVEAELLENGIRLIWETESLACEKELLMRDREFAWKYKLRLKRSFVSCQQMLPLLIHDGKNELRIQPVSDQQLSLSFGGQQSRLTCEGAVQIGISLTRSLMSVSGAAALAYVTIPGPYTADSEIEWETRLIAN
ncbi:hypothetical protein [Paenibacillus sp. J2TS4]|uniref:hypothetical protein n=1 Tax=Paenibacillus sp. J2TS4 TaxID=2807194 RepID=UPI001B026E35|nr:hypothetical protein [Paenibacillus sp. J2TS4]GIP32699.1 hypothetical protein J2TS4_19090 [Paenibacillus sp. J2TS4]